MNVRFLAISLLLLPWTGDAAWGAQSTSQPSEGAEKQFVETIDARVLPGRVVSIGDGELWQEVGGAKQTMALRDVAEVHFAGAKDLMSTPGQPVVVTAGGDQLSASELLLSDGQVGFYNPTLGSVSLALSYVKSIYLPSLNQTAAQLRSQCERMMLSPQRRDLLVAEKEDGGDQR